MQMIEPRLIARLEKIAKSKNIDPNKMLEDYLNRYEYNETLIDITIDAVISANASYQITAFNQGAEMIFGHQKQDILGQSLNTLIPEHFHDIHQQHLQNFAEDQDSNRLMNQREKISGKRKDGTLFPAEATISKSGQGENFRFHVILRDISQVIETRQQLEFGEQRLRLVMDNVSDLVCLHELDGCINFASLSSYQITGYHPEELVGKTPYDYIHPQDEKLIRNLYDILFTGEHIDPAIYRFRHKEGHYIWCETKAHIVMNSDNIATHMVSVTRDITEQLHVHRELQQERDLLVKIMNTSPSGISVVDKNGTIEFANDRSNEILRVNRTDQLGRTYDSSEWKHTDLDGSPWPDEKQPFVRVMTTGEPVYNVQHAIESPDGQRVLLSINGAPILDSDGNVSKVVFTIEDITEIKRAEESLRDSLAKERDVNTLKSRFLSIVSHEFRTPLTVILSSADLLEHYSKEKLTSKELNRLEQIRTQVKYLDMQLDEVSILNKSNQISQTLNLEQTYVVDLLNHLISETQTRYKSCPPIKIITPHTKTDHFFLDPQLIQHILTNLISNAVKFSKGQGEITITLTGTDKNFYFSIKDQGIGIRQDDQENLFDFFFRGENVGGVKGTGVGLAVVKQSVEAHNGKIEFVSQEGIGTTFTVTIPIQPV
jgi:PAS domain S-box-containing protein